MKTDSQVQQDVLAELKWEPSVNAAQIGVEVNDGIVTLAGHVGSFAEKWDAERAAQRVSGVKALAVEMDVRLAHGDVRTDADLARTAENALMWTTFLPSESVKVMVENGWITLTGTVDWSYQRDSASRAVRYLMGVKGVHNHLMMETKPLSGTVKSDIESAIQRRAQTDSNSIKVAVSGSDVTLTGTVHSWSERELAAHTAWGTPGVHKVTDNITIAY
jgi:osmotically-inducible protein OsmY